MKTLLVVLVLAIGASLHTAGGLSTDEINAIVDERLSEVLAATPQTTLARASTPSPTPTPVPTPTLVPTPTPSPSPTASPTLVLSPALDSFEECLELHTEYIRVKGLVFAEPYIPSQRRVYLGQLVYRYRNVTAPECQELSVEVSEYILDQFELYRSSITATKQQAEPSSTPTRRQHEDPRYSVSGFRCTGSMKPYIDCEDEARWLDNPGPDAIEVGDVISFSPTSECQLSGGGYVAHRVTAVRVGPGGRPEYRTQGDNNRSDDGCWIPYSNVDGLLVDLYEGVCPQCKIDTSDYDRVGDEVDALDTAYDRFEAEYDAYVTAYCPGNTCPSIRYDEAARLYDRLKAAGDAYNSKLGEYKAHRCRLFPDLC